MIRRLKHSPSLNCAVATAMFVAMTQVCHAQPVAEQPDFKVGDTWVFASINATSGNPGQWSRSVREILPDGRMRVRFPNGNMATYDSAMNHMPDGRPDRTIQFARFPMKVGDEWKVSVQFDNPAEERWGRAKVLAYEKLTVLAGTFDCFLVEVDEQYGQKLYNSRTIWKRWYCPEIKWIAKETYETRVNNPYGPGSVSGSTSQLFSFSPGN